LGAFILLPSEAVHTAAMFSKIRDFDELVQQARVKLQNSTKIYRALQKGDKEKRNSKK